MRRCTQKANDNCDNLPNTIYKARQITCIAARRAKAKARVGQKLSNQIELARDVCVCRLTEGAGEGEQWCRDWPGGQRVRYRAKAKSQTL